MQELTPPENATTPSISLTAPEPVREIQKAKQIKWSNWMTAKSPSLMPSRCLC